MSLGSGPESVSLTVLTAQGRSPPPVCMCALSHVQLFANPWTEPAGSSICGIFQEEYWSGLPTLGDLPDPGIKPTSLVSPALANGFFTTLAVSH